MPKCIVDYCRNYAGMRNNYANVILHGFPTTLERIKLWLRAIQQSGQVFENLDELAEKIREGKKSDSYRMCSEHFTIQCYFLNGDKKILKKDSVPSVFANRQYVPLCRTGYSRKRPETINSLDKKPLKKKSSETMKENKDASKPKKVFKKNTQKLKDTQELAQKLLNLTLGIIALLTGEDYIVVKKSCPQVKLDRRPQCSKMVPQSRILDWANEQKILELANQITKLLRGEEEKNKEEEKQTYIDVTMRSQQTRPRWGDFQVYEAPPSCMDVESIIIWDYGEDNDFKVSSWMTTSEGNGTKHLILREESQNLSAVDKPILSGQGSPSEGSQYRCGQREPGLTSQESRLERDLNESHGHVEQSVIRNREVCSSDPPAEHTKQRTFQTKEKCLLHDELNTLNMNISPGLNSPLQMEESQGSPPSNDDQVQYTSVIFTGEPTSPLPSDLPILEPDSPEYIPVIIKDVPDCWEESHLANRNISVPSGQTQHSAVCTIEDLCDKVNINQPITSSPTVHYMAYITG
ncbi:oocyte zinc finger protein XlCOF29-like [Hyperolius riggenbachi]|uniref:oocyte zinc finger protein XlCOF29-like n=1 Tax=Hyperolius riggenbachi TaxID=752182 RepID=UPI0035A39F35